MHKIIFPLLSDRVFVVLLAGASVAWIPVVGGFPELFHYIQEVTSFLSPPVCAVYVLAVSWKRINEQVRYIWSIPTNTTMQYYYNVIMQFKVI